VETLRRITVTGGANLRSENKIDLNENVKIVFCAYLHEKWIDLRQTNTKLILSQSYTYRWIHFTGRNAALLRYFSVCLSVFCLFVCHIPCISFAYSILERCRKCIFSGKLPFTYASKQCTSNIKSSSKSRWHWERKCKKKIFAHILVKIFTPSNIFHQRKWCVFVIICLSVTLSHTSHTFRLFSIRCRRLESSYCRGILLLS